MTLSTRLSTVLSSGLGSSQSGDGDAVPPIVAPDAGTDAGTYTGAGYVALTGTAASGGSGSFTYLWSSPAGTFTNATNLTTATFKPSAAGGAQVVTLTATDDLTLLTAQDTVTINVPALVAGDAGTDSGSWTDTVQTLAGTAGSGGAGTITTAWTKTAGTGTATFSDATSRTSTVRFSLPGSFTLTLTYTDAIGQTVTDTVVLAATRTAMYGARYHWHFEPRIQAPTLNGANVSQLNDIAPSAYHMTQGTAANQPLYDTTGGPNSTPCVTPNDANDRIGNSAIALSTGRYLTRIAAVKSPSGGAAFKSIAQSRDQNTEAGDLNLGIGRADSDKHMPIVKVAGGSQEAPQLTTPAHSTAWLAWRITYRAAAVPLITVGGVTGIPAPSGTGACGVVESIWWGHTSVSAGSMAFDLCVEAIGTNELAMEVNYMSTNFGLTLS